MNDSERLVQRFLDQELSAEERVRFVTRLGRDESLRRQVIALEQLALDASRLPRPRVPDGFVDRVLARAVPGQPIPVWRRLTGALLAPRTLRWNLASAVPATCLVVLLLGVLINELVPGPPAGNLAPTTASLAPQTVLVRLVVVQPGAKTVQVAGDFNGWDPGRTPLEQVSAEAWAVTIPLEPGRYEYMFVVNGQQWIADPFAVERSDDGFGSQNAVLDIRPPAGAM